MSSSPFPLVTATIVVQLPPAIVQDINTHWLSEASGPVGFLAAAVAAGDTTITLAAAPSGLSVGQTILCDTEPMSVTAINGAVLTVSRAATAFPFTLALPVQPTTTHASGAAVYVLQWPDPWTTIAQEGLRPWTQQVVNGLGPKSATYGAMASGSLST